MKKTGDQIQSYYQKKQVVALYKKRRFSGRGGEFVHQQEVLPIKSAMAKFLTSRKQSVLDIGCGSGRLTLELLPLSKNVFGLDASAEMLAILSQRFPQSRIMQQSVFEKLPQKLRFDVITSLRFFEHFGSDDQRKILTNFRSHLETDGRFIFATVNGQSLESVLGAFFPYGRYNYFYTDGEYRKMFQELGFEVEYRSQAFFFPRGAFLALQKVPVLFDVMFVLDGLLSKVLPFWCSYFVYTLAHDSSKL